MKIGYLHIGAVEHGIHRYGRFLATEAKSRSGLTVIEAAVELTSDAQVDRQNLLSAAATLSQADIVHFQHNAHIWGKRQQVQTLKTFLDACTPPKVATLHDLFHPPHSSLMMQQIKQGKKSVSELLNWLPAVAREQLSPNVRGLQQVLDRTSCVFVCTEEESKRLAGYTALSQVKTIPHFVEPRTLSITPEAARQRLNLNGKTIITLLGFIYEGKGHDLLVKALAKLPAHYQVVFAGGLGHESFLQNVLDLAKTLNVFDRVRVTGYLSDADQELYLAATDLAVCPFEDTSASGSLCTWISANKSILASDLPQIAEYNRMQPNAILTFSPYTPEALSAAIQQATSPRQTNGAIAQLHRQLELSTVFDQHLHYYTNA